MISAVSFLMLILIACTKSDDSALQNYGIIIYPENNSTIWGNQMVSLDYNGLYNVGISRITLSGGTKKEILASDSMSIRSDCGSYNFILHAEQFAGHSVTVTFEFTNEDINPVTYTYQINHVPVIHFTSSHDGYKFLLDASQSVDPESKPLTFTWTTKDTTVHTATFLVDSYVFLGGPILLDVADEQAHATEIIGTDPQTGLPTTLTNKLKCIDLELKISGASVNAPGNNLGPNINPGDMVPLDADNKLSRPFIISFMFEIKGTIIQGPSDIIEGQDIASTWQYGTFTPHNKSGKQRDPNDRSKLLDGNVTAPFPDPFPPTTEPVLAEDDYTYHPSKGKTFVNTSTGVSKIDLMNKQAVIEDGKAKIVWNDNPYFSLNAGVDITKGFKYKRFFRAWMTPDLSLCQKYFVYEVEIDETGKVIKNNLTPFNF